MTGREFVVIGENVHATRVVLRSSPRVGTDTAGNEALVFTDVAGEARYLPVPSDEKETRTYGEGKIKHVRVALRTAMAGGPDAPAALAYLEALVVNQIQAGAHYIDLNVDELSLVQEERVEAMRWLVRTVAPWAEVPVAVDSSSLETIEAGMEEAASLPAGRPMLNSASLERPAALDVAARVGGPVIVTAAGESGIPGDADGRVENASRMVELALARDIALERVFVDPLVFPISVNSESGQHCLVAFRRLRERFGPEIRLTGGMSNVSFGLPHRRLLNDAFLYLAVEAGADSGIIDPLSTSVERLATLDRESRPFRLAIDVLTGADPNCRAYIKAYRAGELEVPEVAA